MIIRTRAYARAGLIGNPSDGYFGKTISVILRNFCAEVTCFESPRLSIQPRRADRLEFDNISGLIEDVRLNGYYGGIRLIKATIKKFGEYCDSHGIHLDNRNFTIEYTTDIPVRVGLAGSSGIVTATFRAMMSFYGVEIARPLLPNLILSVELDELGIGAGLQDRVIQVYEGCVYMDFDRKLMDERGYGNYEPLRCGNLPPLFVAYHSNLAEGTEVVHNDLRSRWNRGDKEVHAAMDEFAGYAKEARDLIEKGDGDKIGPLLNRNFDLRARLCQISAGNRRLVEIGRTHAESCKFAGSGGAVIGTYDGSQKTFRQLEDAYAEMGASVVNPEIG